MGSLSRRVGVGDFWGSPRNRYPMQRCLVPWLFLFTVLAGFDDPARAVKRHNLLPARAGNAAWVDDRLLSTVHTAVGENLPAGGTGHLFAARMQLAATPPATLAEQEPARPRPSATVPKRSDTLERKPSPSVEAPDMPGIQRHEIVPPKPVAAPEPEVTLAHDQERVVLPQISPIPGVTFVATMIRLMEDELHGRTLGWRPNDVLLGRFTDNVNNFQLGVLEAMRFTTMRLKDSLTRMGDADTYDPDLEAALNLLMNRASLFWFPSAETSYGEAVEHLQKFLVKLETRQRHFYYRTDNLKLLVVSYKDLLGNVNRNLIRTPISWFKSDDYFYYAKGVAHVYYEILKVVRVGFYSQLANTLDALDIMDEILHELHRVEQMDPWFVLDSAPNSLFANHRANINAPLSEAVHLLGVLAQF